MAALNTNLFAKLSRKWVGQVGSGGVANNSDTTIPLSSTTNLPTDTGVIAVIDRVDANGVKTPTLEETVIGVVSGSNLTTCTRGIEGTAQAHSAGAVVEILVTAKGWNNMVDGILVEHNQLGGHTNITASNITASATTSSLHYKVIASGDFLDANSNELFKFTQTASAVNEFTVANAATGNSPTISATGGDTDIDINLTPKGAGDINIPTGVNIQVNAADPKRGLYIPASALFPATTTGCAALAQGETTTNKINYKYLAFDASTEEYAWFHMPTPDYWDLGTITVKFHWTAASSTGDVIWGAAGLCRSDDDALDTALGTAVTVTDTLTATGDEHTTAATSAITIGGTPVKGDKLYLRVYRDADAGGDTLAADAHLTGITVKFSTGQYDDQ